MRTVEERLEALEKAFPNSDPEGHRRYHEAEIRKLHEHTERMASLKYEVAKWAVLAIIGWAAVALWGVFVRGPG